MSRSFNGKIALALTGLALVGGILLAQLLFKRSLRDNTTSTGNVNSSIAEIVIAAVTDPTKLNDPNPPLMQFRSYNTTDNIALKITTTSDAPKEQEMTARLLAQDGSIKPLNPPSFTFSAGTSVFCCWQIDTPGEYTIQLFRSSGGVTTIPISIKTPTGGGGTSPFSL